MLETAMLNLLDWPDRWDTIGSYDEILCLENKKRDSIFYANNIQKEDCRRRSSNEKAMNWNHINWNGNATAQIPVNPPPAANRQTGNNSADRLHHQFLTDHLFSSDEHDKFFAAQGRRGPPRLLRPAESTASVQLKRMIDAVVIIHTSVSTSTKLHPHDDEEALQQFFEALEECAQPSDWQLALTYLWITLLVPIEQALSRVWAQLRAIWKEAAADGKDLRTYTESEMRAVMFIVRGVGIFTEASPLATRVHFELEQDPQMGPTVEMVSPRVCVLETVKGVTFLRRKKRVLTVLEKLVERWERGEELVEAAVSVGAGPGSSGGRDVKRNRQSEGEAAPKTGEGDTGGGPRDERVDSHQIGNSEFAAGIENDAVSPKTSR